ncbi:MAG TPA: 50S ribosomal protein L11 methyltransferase [Thermomicrobiaceae bacterium]|nr:50S ribosomal protein L11 methyltransferase [Thermomicrobiaceae bacterium]
MAATDRSGPTPSGWLEVRVQADAESVESVAELLSRFGYNQGVVVEEPFVQDADGDNLTIDPTRPVSVSTYLPRDVDLDERVRRLREGLWHLRQIGAVGDVETVDRPEEDWANAWKEHFQVTRLGRRFVVRPSWRPYEPRPDDVVIDLDPGMAFGTGLHPTTELCMRWLEDLPVAGRHVLDAGAGSGILSIAAVKLGAADVDAVEVDPVSISALRHNIELNALSERIRVVLGDVSAVLDEGRRYDLILANILSSILIRVAGSLVSAARPGGRLVLSGIIEVHEAEVVATFESLGCRLVERRAAADWVALLLERAS